MTNQESKSSCPLHSKSGAFFTNAFTQKPTTSPDDQYTHSSPDDQYTHSSPSHIEQQDSLPEHLQRYVEDSADPPPQSLSKNRIPSSIPRVEPSESYPSWRWHYPSPQRFYLAMRRKGYHVEASHVPHILAIHNRVNEQSWREVMRWELRLHFEECMDRGPRLESFRGRPRDLSPRARLNMMIGKSAPFDRHDWIIERCGKSQRYIIDFYQGKSSGESIFLDVRPALDSWQGLKDRCTMWWRRQISGEDCSIPEDRLAYFDQKLNDRESLIKNSEGLSDNSDEGIMFGAGANCPVDGQSL